MSKGEKVNNSMAMVACPNSSRPVWANACSGKSFRCTKCGADNHTVLGSGKVPKEKFSNPLKAK